MFLVFLHCVYIVFPFIFLFFLLFFPPIFFSFFPFCLFIFPIYFCFLFFSVLKFCFLIFHLFSFFFAFFSSLKTFFQARPERRLRAPQFLQKTLCSTPAIRKPAAAQAAATRAATPLEGFVQYVCHTKASRGPAAQPRPNRRPRAPQLLQEALYTAPATRKPGAAQAAATRAVAPPRGYVYCLPYENQPRPKRRPRTPQLLQQALCIACHTKASRGPSGDPSGGHVRRKSARRLCIPRLPHES